MNTVLPKSWWWLGMPISALAYWIWSFSLTDPNLVFTSWNPYWQFQLWVWQLQRSANWQSWWFLLIMASWWLITAQLWRASTHPRQLQSRAPSWLPNWCLGLTVLILILANNALSHDLFNYLFNAKMVVVYQANPHAQTALEFAQDPWVRFMHNTHTPAPYGYGWTAWSLIPFLLGMGKFTLTWLVFKGWMAISWLALWGSYLWLRSKKSELIRTPATGWVALVNPLILVEVLGNGHNDLWMMLPALWALIIIRDAISWPKIITSSSLLIVSFNVKLATLLLFPWGLLVIILRWMWPANWLPSLRRFVQNTWQQYWGDLAVISLFLPLLTARSQFFHPWYWLWCLVWYPYVSQAWLRRTLLIFAISSTFRYWPWLAAGTQYSPEIVWHQQVITWLPSLVLIGGFFLSGKFFQSQTAASPKPMR